MQTHISLADGRPLQFIEWRGFNMFLADLKDGGYHTCPPGFVLECNRDAMRII